MENSLLTLYNSELNCNFVSKIRAVMKVINWGFIGCGEVTEKKSGPAFNEVEGSKVVAVMSRNEDKARSYAERHHVRKWYTDAQKLIDDAEVNAVYIATPPSSHATFAIMAMRAGKPVYVEKPLAASYEDCARINRVSKQTGIPCFVAYYRRYLPYFLKVKEIIDNGLIGHIINVQIRFSVPPRDLDYQSHETLPWRLQPDISGGGYFYDLASHQLDMLQDIFGVITRAHGYPANRAHLYEAFSVYNYDPIQVITSSGAMNITVPNPAYVQLPIIREVIEDLQGINVCTCTSISATPVNWVMDRILGKF